MDQLPNRLDWWMAYDYKTDKVLCAAETGSQAIYSARKMFPYLPEARIRARGVSLDVTY